MSTLAGLSYHICGKLEVAFKDSPSSQHQHCTDEAQKAEIVLSAVRDTYIYSQFSRGTVLNTLKQSGINILRGKKDATTFSRQACFVNRFTDFDGTVTTKPTSKQDTEITPHHSAKPSTKTPPNLANTSGHTRQH